MPRDATCSPISRATTVVSGSTPPSATSPPNRQRQYPHNPVSTLPGEGQAMRAAPERLAICLMVIQGVLFSAETALIHYLGPTISAVHFGVIRGFAGVVTAMLFARRVDVFCTEQFPIHMLRGIAALTYGWVLVYSFSRLPFADATAISYTQSVYIALFSIFILGEPISRLRWLSVLFGIGGA